MNAPKPLAEQGAALLKQHKGRSDREMREAIEESMRENSPAARERRIEFDPFIARIQRRQTPTKDDLVRAVIDELQKRGHVTNYGGNLKFRSASAPTATPIRTPEQLQRAVHGSTGTLITLDLCSEILNFLAKE